MARAQQKKAGRENLDLPTGQADDELDQNAVTIASNVISIAEFKARRQSATGSIRHKFRVAPIIPGVQLKGWHPGLMTVLDVERFDDLYRKSVTLKFAIAEIEPFAFITTFGWGEPAFEWPQSGISRDVTAHFRPIQYSGQPASRLIEIMDSAMVAVAA
jgi:hypothetical protein